MPYPTNKAIDEIENVNFESSKLENIVTKKESKNVRFDTVDVYYFERQQGFCSIPNTGLNTLGNSF
jgi:hypothetical protein